jgi:hypothetical protein
MMMIDDDDVKIVDFILSLLFYYHWDGVSMTGEFLQRDQIWQRRFDENPSRNRNRSEKLH